MNKDIKQYNNKGQRHGLWKIYLWGDRLMCQRFYQNDKLVGYHEQFYKECNNINNSLTRNRKKYHI